MERSRRPVSATLGLVSTREASTMLYRAAVSSLNATAGFGMVPVESLRHRFSAFFAPTTMFPPTYSSTEQMTTFLGKLYDCTSVLGRPSTLSRILFSSGSNSAEISFPMSRSVKAKRFQRDPASQGLRIPNVSVLPIPAPGRTL